MLLRVRSALGAESRIVAEGSQSVKQLRCALGLQLKRGMDDFYLCFDQETLTDDYALDDYGLNEGSVIYCVTKERGSHNLRARLENGVVLPVLCRITDTVQKLKRLIAETAYGKRCPLNLSYQGRLLEDLATLQDCNIAEQGELLASKRP